MKTITEKTKAQKAIDYLSSRNVLNEYWDNDQYYFALQEYYEVRGDEAIMALAGFYYWCIHNIEDADKQERMLTSTFAHDLGQMYDDLMSPRSSSYLKYWDR